jgi:hypothetical protein
VLSLWAEVHSGYGPQSPVLVVEIKGAECETDQVGPKTIRISVHRGTPTGQTPSRVRRPVQTHSHSGVHNVLRSTRDQLEQDLEEFCKGIKTNLTELPDYILDRDELLYHKDPDGQPRLVVPETLVTTDTRTPRQ